MKSRIWMLFLGVAFLCVCGPNRASGQETARVSADAAIGLLPKVIGPASELNRAAATLDVANRDVLEIRMDLAHVKSERMNEIKLSSERLSVVAMDSNEAEVLIQRIADDKIGTVISRPRVLVLSGGRAQIMVSLNHEDCDNQTEKTGAKVLNTFDISLTPNLKDQAVAMDTKIEITRTIADDRESTPAINAKSIAFPYTYELEKSYVLSASPLSLLVILRIHRTTIPVSEELQNALSSHKAEEVTLNSRSILLKKEREIAHLRLEVAALRAACDTSAGSSVRADSIGDRRTRSRLRSAELRLSAAERSLQIKQEAFAAMQMETKPTLQAISAPELSSLNEIHADVKHMQRDVDRLLQLLEARK